MSLQNGSSFLGYSRWQVGHISAKNKAPERRAKMMPGGEESLAAIRVRNGASSGYDRSSGYSPKYKGHLGESATAGG